VQATRKKVGTEPHSHPLAVNNSATTFGLQFMYVIFPADINIYGVTSHQTVHFMT